MDKLAQPHIVKSPCGKAVFIANLKCASRFYLQNLSENSWMPITDQEIDWQHNLVFSTIINPLERYARGLVQDLKCFDVDMSVWESMSANFWQEVSWLGVHSMPISYVFGDKVSLVNWIPLDLPGIEHQSLTKELLAQKGIDIQWHVENKINQSGDREKLLKNKIKELCWGHIKNDFLYNRFPDFDIYDRAVRKIKNKRENS